MSEANKDKTNEEQSSVADDHTQSARSANGTTSKNAPIIPRRGARPRFDKTFSANEKFSPSA